LKCDFLTGLRSMERTLTHQHRKVIDEIEQEKVSISVSHRIPLFREVIGKISSNALAKALALRNNYLSVGAPGTLHGFDKRVSGSHAFTRFARRLKANGLSPFHNSTVIGIYSHLQQRKLL